MMSVGSSLDLAVLSLDGSRFTTGCCSRCSIARTRGCSGPAVGLLADALHCALQVFCRAAHAREIAACERIAYGPDLVLNLAAQARRDSVTHILQRPLGLICHAV